MMEQTQRYIVALDQGTTSSRALVFDAQLQVVSRAQKEFTQIYPQPGWVEQDPMDIWATQSAVLIEALAQASIDLSQVAALGITNQRETTIIWDKETGKPIYNALVWQSRQTQSLCQQLIQAGHQPRIRELTGLVIDPYFSATKICWILDQVPGSRERARRGELLFGTVDSWLLWKLTRGQVHATDYTNASRTLLFDIHQRCWSEELLALFDIPAAMLPEVRPSMGLFGHTDGLGGLRQDIQIPIFGMIGDQQGALFGQQCVLPGQAKNTYGTGCFLLMNTGAQAVNSTQGLLTTLACDAQGQPVYALEGAVFNGGSAVQWLRDELKLIHDALDSEYFANKAHDNQGVYVVPAFTGLGAPYWDADARGAIFGLTRGVGSEHLIRATLESIAYQTADILLAMQADAGQPLQVLRVDGGGSANNFLMQFQADLLATTVERPIHIESTALGAALLAGLGAGFWPDFKCASQLLGIERTFEPIRPVEEMQRLYRGWLKAVSRTRHWASTADDESF